MSSHPQRRVHEGAGDQRQRPRPFGMNRQHRVGEPECQNLGVGPLRQDDPRGLCGGKGCGLSRVIDLSATPFFLRGSGYAEGTLFPWTMSDFSLMDAML
jgi:hypothetical protein